MPASHGGVLYYVVKVPKETKDTKEDDRSGASRLDLKPDQANSTDSGWDNPFRPDGDLSREADEIVELIKEGKPITPTPGAPASPLSPGSPAREAPQQQAHSSPVTSTPQKNGAGANGNAALGSKAAPALGSSPASGGGGGAVDVQRGTVAAGDSAQVEHVTLKKKPKCKCCIIQ